MNSSGIVYPYISTPIGKPLLVSILFCSQPINSLCHVFRIILIDHQNDVGASHVIMWCNIIIMTIRSKDVGLICWCLLSNIMPNSISHESMRQGITCSVALFVFSVFCCFFVCCLFFFCRVILLFPLGDFWLRFPQWCSFVIVC